MFALVDATCALVLGLMAVRALAMTCPRSGRMGPSQLRSIAPAAVEIDAQGNLRNLSSLAVVPELCRIVPACAASEVPR